MRRERTVGGLAEGIAKVLIAGLFLFPLLLGLTAAFRPDQEMFRFGGRLSVNTLIPAEPTLANFREVIARPDFVPQILNTVVLGVVQSTLTVIVALMAAFALGRMEFRGRDAIFFAILATVFVPFEAVVVPLFLVVRDLEMLNSFSGLLIPWIASPVAIFLLRQSIQQIPRDLDAAAMLDGAGLWELFKTVVLPNSWPAMTTVWLVTFIYVWDSFLWPLIVIDDPSRQLVQVGISSLFNPERVRYGLVFAGSVLAVGPVIVLFMFLQRFYVRSVASSGIK